MTQGGWGKEEEEGGGGEMACSRPAMEMDLSAQACLLIREALALKTAKMEEVMEQLQCCNLPSKVYFSAQGVGCCGDQR